MPSVLVKLDNLKAGSLVTLPGLGGFKNGETTDIPQSKFDSFAARPNVGHMIANDKIVVTNKTLSGEPVKQDKPKEEKPSKSTDEVKPEEDSSD